MPDCVIDQRPTDSALCHSCLDQLRTELRAVRWLTAQLTITLTRQAVGGDRNGPRSAERPLPFHPAASVDLESLRDGLAYWCRDIAQRRHVTLDTPHTPDGYARWLLRWPSELAGHPDAAELHGDILALTRAARRTIDRHPDLRYLGPCDACGADLYVPPHATHATCRGERTTLDQHGNVVDTTPCEAVYEVEPRRIWLLEQAVDQLRTARQLSAELPWIAGVQVSAKLISMWALRDKITTYLPHPHDQDRASRFRVGEVIDVAREMAVKRQAKATGAA
ncbi:MAG: hypothetical protein AB7G23_21135 [Vicinamibacterales bacterium]